MKTAPYPNRDTAVTDNCVVSLITHLAFLYFKWQQLNQNGYGKFYGSEIVAVYKHKIQWKWSDTSKKASRATITLSKQGLNA